MHNTNSRLTYLRIRSGLSVGKTVQCALWDQHCMGINLRTGKVMYDTCEQGAPFAGLKCMVATKRLPFGLPAGYCTPCV
jgi:hypothetical protein